MSDSSRSPARVLVAVIAVGVVLRLVGLGVHSLWIDEAGTMYVAKSTDIVSALRGDRHPPLSFLLFRWWSTLVGEEDAWLRLAPALASIASLFLLARLAREFLTGSAVWIAVAIAAVSPLELWIAREVRMYAFVECAGLVAITAASAHLARPRAWLIIAVFAGSAIATGMHYFGAFVGPTVAVLALTAWTDAPARRRIVTIVCAALAGAIAWVPWFASVYRDQTGVNASFLSNLGPRSLAELPARLIVPTTDMLPAWCVRPAYVAAVLVSLACFIFTIESIRKRRRGDLASAAVLVTSPVCALSGALFGPLSFLARYFALSMPGAALVVASGLASIPWKWSRFSLTTLLLSLLAMLSLAVHSKNDREDWRTACERVASDFRPGDRILPLTHLTIPYSEAPLRHYWRDSKELLDALTTRSAAIEAVGNRPRLHVIYRETRYATAEYKDLTRRYRIVVSESLHGAIHRTILE